MNPKHAFWTCQEKTHYFIELMGAADKMPVYRMGKLMIVNETNQKTQEASLKLKDWKANNNGRIQIIIQCIVSVIIITISKHYINQKLIKVASLIHWRILQNIYLWEIQQWNNSKKMSHWREVYFNITYLRQCLLWPVNQRHSVITTDDNKMNAFSWTPHTCSFPSFICFQYSINWPL